MSLYRYLSTDVNGCMPHSAQFTQSKPITSDSRDGHPETQHISSFVMGKSDEDTHPLRSKLVIARRSRQRKSSARADPSDGVKSQCCCRGYPATSCWLPDSFRREIASRRHTSFSVKTLTSIWVAAFATSIRFRRIAAASTADKTSR